MSGIGYLEIGQFIKGEITLEDAIQKSIARTYQYAKRQKTWFKRDTRINWIKNIKESNLFIKEFLKN